MDARPAFSIIVPVFNGARHLPAALASLAAQERGAWDMEIIAADDGSADGSRGILQDAARTLPLTLIEGAKSGNWVASVNKAMRLASGAWVGMLHQDDAFAPGRLSALAAMARDFPGAQALANAARFIDGSGRAAGAWDFPAHARRAVFLPPAEVLPRLLVQNNFAVPGVVFRRSLLDGLGCFDESLRYAADWDFWLRIAARHGFAYAPERLSDFRLHGASQTMAFAKERAEQSENMRRTLARGLCGAGASGVVERAAWLGVAVNGWLASRAGGGGAEPLGALILALRAAGPRSALLYLRWSRVPARLCARLRAGLRPQKRPRANG